METTSTENTLIHLPSLIDDRLDLAEINQQLHDKTAQLGLNPTLLSLSAK